MGEEESTLLELGKVKPISEEEENNRDVELSKSKSKPKSSIPKEEEQKVSREEEQVVNHPKPNWRRRHPCLACCGVCCLISIVILGVILILVFTLFKAKNPRIHVDSITLDNFTFSLPLDIPPSFTLNATLGIQLSLKNPNRASVKYTNSTAHLFYRGIEVGYFPIPPGHVRARRTEHITSAIDLMADRLVTSRTILSDITSGSLPISTTTHVSGRVKVLNIFKHHFESSSVCNITIFTSNRSISNTFCTYDLDL